MSTCILFGAFSLFLRKAQNTYLHYKTKIQQHSSRAHLYLLQLTIATLNTRFFYHNMEGKTSNFSDLAYLFYLAYF